MAHSLSHQGIDRATYLKLAGKSEEEVTSVDVSAVSGAGAELPTQVGARYDSTRFYPLAQAQHYVSFAGRAQTFPATNRGDVRIGAGDVVVGWHDGGDYFIHESAFSNWDTFYRPFDPGVVTATAVPDDATPPDFGSPENGTTTYFYRRWTVARTYELVVPSHGLALTPTYLERPRPAAGDKPGRLLVERLRQQFYDGSPSVLKVALQGLDGVGHDIAAPAGTPTLTLISAGDVVALWALRGSGPTPNTLLLTDLDAASTVTMAAGLTNAQRSAFTANELYVLRSNVVFAAREPATDADPPPHLVTGWAPGDPAPTTATFLEEQDTVDDVDGTEISGALADVPDGVQRTQAALQRLVDVQVVPAPEDR